MAVTRRPHGGCSCRSEGRRDLASLRRNALGCGGPRDTRLHRGYMTVTCGGPRDTRAPP